MSADSLQIQNLNDLRNYVLYTLCEQNELERGAFDITERILVRGNKACGIYFCLHGPRSVKLTAIWETERNTILFYGSSGERTAKTQLEAAPSLDTPAGRMAVGAGRPSLVAAGFRLLNKKSHPAGKTGIDNSTIYVQNTIHRQNIIIFRRILTMLVLSRKESERIRLGNNIVVTVVRVSGDRVRIGIEAPPEVIVLRDELQPRQALASGEVKSLKEAG